MKRSESGVKWSESGGEWSRESVRRCSIKKFTVSGRALVLRLSVVISIKVPYTSTSYRLPPVSTIFETLRDATLRPTATIFLLAARYWFLTFASTSRATHLCSTSMRSEGSAHTLATSTPRIAIQAGLVESWTGCTKVCRYRNCHCSAASHKLSSTQDREDFRWYDETGVRIP